MSKIEGKYLGLKDGKHNVDLESPMHVVTVTDFRKNLAKTMRIAKEKIVLVVNHNKVVGVVMSPELYADSVEVLFSTVDKEIGSDIEGGVGNELS